ncbi:hypothetical protein [Aquimarina sp. 2201CG5-10]|uniref:hypothetical protein n=1 Tax=Aquimarina callyspongiae TaxID=3098150 RepID=UPI002AB4CA57|nr:hypothetical protein [Aquimarina sp. 2201CG5-10]MDY8136093.1 hypothetical protein [Aquimarina sp. 2201CG5-10]
MQNIGALFLFCICFLNIHVNGQEKESKLTINGFSYSDPSESDQHKYFIVSYQADSNLFAEIHGYYDTYVVIDVFKVPVMAKKYISNKWYVFSGFETEFIIDKKTSTISEPIFKLINGAGYEFNSNFSMEVKQDYNFNVSKEYGNFTNPGLFSLKAKYKF